jgi:hypothetical protein
VYSNDELESILIRAISTHQSLDMKKHLIEAVTKVFDKLETYEDFVLAITYSDAVEKTENGDSQSFEIKDVDELFKKVGKSGI